MLKFALLLLSFSSVAMGSQGLVITSGPVKCGGGLIEYGSDCHEEITRILQSVNLTKRYRSDVGEHWEVLESEGDCEDFALAYRQRLKASGFNNTYLVFSETGNNERHLSTYVGGWLLDNRHDYPVSLGEIRHVGEQVLRVGDEQGVWRRAAVRNQ